MLIQVCWSCDLKDCRDAVLNLSDIASQGQGKLLDSARLLRKCHWSVLRHVVYFMPVGGLMVTAAENEIYERGSNSDRVCVHLEKVWVLFFYLQSAFDK